MRLWGCQRTFARRMVERADDHGLQARMGFEAEWVVDAGAGDEFVPAISGPGYGMDRLIEASITAVGCWRPWTRRGWRSCSYTPAGSRLRTGSWMTRCLPRRAGACLARHW